MTPWHQNWLKGQPDETAAPAFVWMTGIEADLYAIDITNNAQTDSRAPGIRMACQILIEAMAVSEMEAFLESVQSKQAVHHLSKPAQTEAVCAWSGEAEQRLSEFEGLGQNWDSYGGAPVTHAALAIARQFLARLSPDVPRAFVVPTSPGGVAFDWSTDDMDFEVEFTPSGEVTIDEDDRSALPEETPLRRAANLAASLGRKSTTS